MEAKVFDFITIFISILYEALPFIVLGALISGFLEELVPQSLVLKVIPRSRILAIGIGAFLGILFPMCECGIIPVMRRLLRKGVPLSCCVCYMLAGPIINIVVMLSTYVAFSGAESAIKAAPVSAPAATLTATTVSTGSSEALSPSAAAVPAAASVPAVPPVPQFTGLQMTAMRMLLGFLVAFGTGLIVEGQYRKHGTKLLAKLAVPQGPVNGDDEPAWDAGEKRSWLQRLGTISETALHDFVDITVFLILGAVLAALSRQFLSHEQMQSLALGYPGLAILIFMGLAILLCICSEADAFIAASFRAVPAAPKLAFLVLGPMLDLKLYMMYTRVFRPRLIWTIITSVVVQVLIYSFLVHFFWNSYGYRFAGG